MDNESHSLEPNCLFVSTLARVRAKIWSTMAVPGVSIISSPTMQYAEATARIRAPHSACNPILPTHSLR
jgi:hypothetical protein